MPSVDEGNFVSIVDSSLPNCHLRLFQRVFFSWGTRQFIQIQGVYQDGKPGEQGKLKDFFSLPEISGTFESLIY